MSYLEPTSNVILKVDPQIVMSGISSCKVLKETMFKPASNNIVFCGEWEG